MCSQDDSPVVEAGLFTVRQTAWPEDQLDVFATYRAARVLNVVTPPVLCFVGVMGNVMTLLVLTCSALRTNACCRYLAALALCDIAVLLLNFCFGFVDAFLYTLLSSDVACKLYYFLFFTCAHLSAWLLVAVTAQRCYVVCRPMTSLTVTSKRCTAYVIGGLTAASVGLNFHHLVIRQLVWSERTGSYMCHTGPGTRDVFVHRVWPWIDSTVYCFLPSPCLVVLNFLLVRALRRAAVFRRSLQCHNRQEKPKRGTCVSTVIRDNAKPQSDVNGSKQASGKLFVCSKVGEPSSRILRSVVVPCNDNPLASAWNADTATPEPNSEDDNFSQRKNWQVKHSIVGCKIENTKLGLKVSEADVLMQCGGKNEHASTSLQLSVSPAVNPVPVSASAELLSTENSPLNQPASRWNGHSEGNRLSNSFHSKGKGRGYMIKTRNNTNAPTGYINNGVSSSFSNKQKCEHSDLITKFRKNRCMKSSFFNKRTYDIKTETHEFGHVTPTPLDDCNDILGLSLTERRDCELHTSALPADNDCGGVASQGAKHQKRENHSRQLTLMPLLASLTFVTLSAPLAVMLVAEHTVWVRNTAEQVALYTLLRLVANTLMYVNHSVNFLLYCFAGTTFRRHCCQLLCKVCCRLCPRHHRCRSSSQSCCVPAS